jgi:hypothetical protein
MRATQPTRSRFAPRPAVAVAAAVLALLALALPAAAESYIVTLDNGEVFQSRYQPETASWDASLILLLTEYGNWIALEKEDVANVTTDVESQGFGHVIDTNTISLGVLPNDAVDPAEQGEPSQADILRQFLTEQQQDQPNYSVDQFAEPTVAGSGGRTGGLPVGFSQQSGSPVLVTP